MSHLANPTCGLGAAVRSKVKESSWTETIRNSAQVFFCYSFFAQAANSLIKVFCVVRPLKFEHGIFFVMAQKGT